MEASLPCVSFFPRSTRSTCVMPVLWKRPLMWLSAWCPNTLKKPSSSVPCTPSPWSPYFSVLLRYSRYSADGLVTSTTNDPKKQTHKMTKGENIWHYFWLFVSYFWTLIKQEAHVRAKPHLWSIVSQRNLRMCDSFIAGKSEIFSRCFFTLTTERSSLVVFQISVGLYWLCLRSLYGLVAREYSKYLWLWTAGGWDRKRGFLFFHMMTERLASSSGSYYNLRSWSS